MTTKLDTLNIAQLAVVLSRYTKLGFLMCGHTAVRLGEIGRTLHRLAEKDCNKGLTERDAERWRRLQAQALAALQELNCRESITVSTQGDPRGYVLRLKFPRGESNNMGGDFGV